MICVLSGDLKDLLDMVPEGLDYNFVATFVFDTQKEKGLFNCTANYFVTISRIL